MTNKVFLEQLLQTNDATVIEKIIAANPYFENAHLHLALQTKNPNHLHNAALILQNELWLQYLLDQKENSITTDAAAQNIEAQSVIINKTAIVSITPTQIELKENETIIVEEKVEGVNENLSEIGNKETKEATEENVFTQNENRSEALKTDVETIQLQNEKVSENTITNEVTTNNEATVAVVNIVPIYTNNDIITTNENNIVQQDNSIDDDNQLQNNEDAYGIMEPDIDINLQKEASHIDLSSLRNIVSDIKTNSNLTQEQSFDKIPIEPFYTVDYFASQGIKTNKLVMNDKLGVQLKSFTQWLKSMKKIDTPLTKEEEITEQQQHGNVVSMAEGSLVKNDILTENMVNVLIKQGKTNEAIDILQKLSLLDTTKSVYFASQIEQLKNL